MIKSCTYNINKNVSMMLDHEIIYLTFVYLVRISVIPADFPTKSTVYTYHSGMIKINEQKYLKLLLKITLKIEDYISNLCKSTVLPPSQVS